MKKVNKQPARNKIARQRQASRPAQTSSAGYQSEITLGQERGVSNNVQSPMQKMVRIHKPPGNLQTDAEGTSCIQTLTDGSTNPEAISPPQQNIQTINEEEDKAEEKKSNKRKFINAPAEEIKEHPQRKFGPDHDASQSIDPVIGKYGKEVYFLGDFDSDPDMHSKTVEFLQKVKQQEKGPLARKCKISVNVFYEQEQLLKPQTEERLIKWHHSECNYLQVLRWQSDKYKDNDAYFDGRLIAEIMFCKTGADQIAQLCQKYLKYDNRKVATGFNEMRRFLNAGARYYCAGCGECNYSKRGKHNKVDCIAKKAEKVQMPRIGCSYFCPLCLKKYSSQKALSIHLLFHNFYDVFYLGLQPRVLASWDGLQANFKTALEQANPFADLFPDNQIPVLTALHLNVWQFDQTTRYCTGEQSKLPASNNWFGLPPLVNNGMQQSVQALVEPIVVDLTGDEVMNSGQDINQEMSQSEASDIKDFVDQFKLYKFNFEQADPSLEETFKVDDKELFKAVLREGRLILGYAWEFFRIIAGGTYSLKEGFDFGFKLHGTERGSKGLIKSTIQHEWGLEMVTTILVDSTRWESLHEHFLRDSSEERLEFRIWADEANYLIWDCWKYQILCTDVWRPCLWYWSRTPECQDELYFLGFHTLLANKPMLYFRRRTMELDVGFKQALLSIPVQPFHAKSDMCLQLLGILCVIVSDMHVTRVVESMDTTANSKLLNSLYIQDIFDWMLVENKFWDDKFGNTLRKHLRNFGDLYRLHLMNRDKKTEDNLLETQMFFYTESIKRFGPRCNKMNEQLRKDRKRKLLNEKVPSCFNQHLFEDVPWRGFKFAADVFEVARYRNPYVNNVEKPVVAVIEKKKLDEKTNPPKK